MHSVVRVPVLVFVMLLSVAHLGAAQEKVRPHRRTISVTGQAEVSAAPDVAIVSLGVVSQKEKAADAASENAARSAKVVAALKSIIGKDDKLMTTGYALEPQYASVKPGEASQPRIVGYLARNQVQIETHKVDATGAVIDAAIAAGANNIVGLQFTLANRSAQLQEALAKAGAEARAQAASIAAALGVSLKGVLRATTGDVTPPRPRPMPRFAQAMEAAPTAVEPGTVTVSATLQVTYEIE